MPKLEHYRGPWLSQFSVLSAKIPNRAVYKAVRFKQVNTYLCPKNLVAFKKHTNWKKTILFNS